MITNVHVVRPDPLGVLGEGWPAGHKVTMLPPFVEVARRIDLQANRQHWEGRREMRHRRQPGRQAACLTMLATRAVERAHLLSAPAFFECRAL